MDMQTMLKKVKQKQYKTKKEFKDDLDLIWNNCYTYNAAEVRVNVHLYNSQSHASLLESPSPSLCETPATQSPQATQEYN